MKHKIKVQVPVEKRGFLGIKKTVMKTRAAEVDGKTYIQSEDDEDALDYYMIGVWLVQHRKYSDWSKEKSFDLANILEFMRVYRISIPRYIKRTRFYRKKLT